LPDEVAGLTDDTYLLCMTQGHGTDLPILLKALQSEKDFPFIGVIGSDVKAKKLRKELVDAGVNEDRVKRIASTLGLPLGNNTPQEIAISIAAQLLALRDRVNFSVEAGRPI
jgi:xanthine dehydrogenase accessory factor